MHISSTIIAIFPRCPGPIALILFPLSLLLMLLLALYIWFQDWYFREPIERFASPPPKPKRKGRRRKNVAWWDDKAGEGGEEGRVEEEGGSGDEKGCVEQAHVDGANEKGGCGVTGEKDDETVESTKADIEDGREEEEVRDETPEGAFDERGRLRYRSPSPDMII